MRATIAIHRHPSLQELLLMLVHRIMPSTLSILAARLQVYNGQDDEKFSRSELVFSVERADIGLIR